MAGTTPALINSTTFISLGVAPVLVQCLGPGAVTIVVSDTLPAVGTAGFAVLPGNPVLFDPADASSNVYAAMAGNPASIVYNLVSSQVG